MKRRANNEGSIYFDTSRDNYKATITAPTKKRISKRFKTKQEALQWIMLTKAEIHKGEYIAASPATMGEWLFNYLEVYKKPKVRLTTMERYYSTLRLCTPISNIKLSDLSSYSLQCFYNSLPAHLSSSTKNHVFILVNAAIRKASALGLMKDITVAVEKPKVEKPNEIEIFTLDEIKQLLAFLQNSNIYRKYYLFIKLAIATGARLGELLALRRENVCNGYIKIDSAAHRTKGSMFITPPKTKNSNRSITIPEDLCNELLKHSGDNYVFTSKGKIWNVETIEQAWKRILQQANIPHKRFHALRHTHATQLLANNVPLLEVSRRLGHARASTTLDLYGHAIAGYDATIAKKLNSIFNL